MKTIYIEDEITEYIDLDSLKINSNQIINKIKQLNILENKKSYKSIFYNIQTDDIIIRNIENINIYTSDYLLNPYNLSICFKKM